MFKNLGDAAKAKYGKGLEERKGAQECVGCGKKHMHRYGDNLEKAKCFSCGLHLNLNVINHGVDYTSIVADRFFEATHKSLFENKQDGKPCQAFVYANETRKIPENILRRSDVGVIPANYDVNKVNEDLIADLNKKIEEETDVGKKEKLQTKLENLEDFIEKLQKFLRDNWDRLIFFYRDENGLITQIKTRKPYIDTKTFQILKVQNKSGVFNQGVFSDDELSKVKSYKKMRKGLIVVEGEFDQLSLATQLHRMDKPIDVCALGGANGDLETAMKIRAERVCILHDNDKAGKTVLDKAKEIRTVFGLTTPEGIKDIDEFINTFKDEKQCNEAVWNLLKSMKHYHREFRGIEAEIRNIMNNTKMTQLDRQQLVSLSIEKEILQRGKFFKDVNYQYIFLDDDKKIIPIIATDEWLKRLLNRMGVNPSREYYNYTVNDLSTFAFDHGTPIETHNFSYHDKNKNAVYISNNDTKVYKITTEDIEELENGDEGIMFNYRPDYEPFKLVKPDDSVDYFEKYVTNSMNIDTDSGNLTEAEYKTLTKVWSLSTFFDMPTKVLLVATGEKGSGKTSTLRRIGIILYGSKYNVTPLPNKPEDFDTLVTNNHLIIFDNVDTGKSWLNDKLASVATGQNIGKRKLYTDNEEIKLPTKTYLALTSRTPQFTRDDVADRLIGIPFKRISEFVPEGELIKDILDHRDEIMSYIMYEIQKVLKAFEITKGRTYKTILRSADFATFGLRIFDALGKKEEFASILEKVCEAQKAFAVEEDSLVYVLKIFAKKQVQPRKMSGFELHKNLLQIANEDMFDIPEFRAKYKSVKSLTRRIANIKGNISNDVKITIYKERANQKSYKIELMDKDFELPPSIDSIFDNIALRPSVIRGQSDMSWIDRESRPV